MNNNKRLSTYVNDEWFNKIVKDAAEAGLSISEYLWAIIEGYYKSLEEIR